MDLSHYERCEPDELTDAIEQLHGLEAAARAQLLALVRVSTATSCGAKTGRTRWRRGCASASGSR